MSEILFHLSEFFIRIWKLFTYVILYTIQVPLKRYVIYRLESNGIIVNGDQPHDIKVKDERMYLRLCQDLSLGFGEAYMDGWWDSDRVDELMCRMLKNGLYYELMYPWNRLINYIQFELFNLQTSARAFQIGEQHYDQGNALFESFLDPTMNYSCGYWKDAKDLNEAQIHKMDLIGRKLKLQPGMRVLDIGCGWGGLCKYLAQNFGVECVGITVSKEGADVAQERCKGLPVDIRVQDYREVTEKFDRIVSVGMFEHVGRRNYRTFFDVCQRCLPDHGLFLLHTIAVDSKEVPSIEPWFNTYIFPNGILPNPRNITDSIEDLFTIEDWHNFGDSYDKTLQAWHANFVKNWPTIEHMFKDPARFYRMWTYYLQISAGGFRSRKYQLWQIALSKKGIPGGYLSVR